MDGLGQGNASRVPTAAGIKRLILLLVFPRRIRRIRRILPTRQILPGSFTVA